MASDVNRTPIRAAASRGWALYASILVEVLGACLILFASGYASLGWVPAIGKAVNVPPAGIQSVLVFAALLAGIVLMFVGYLYSLRWAGRAGPSIGFTLSVTVLMAFPLLLMTTIPSGDVNSYALYGRIEVLYGGNPYIDPPSKYPNDVFVQQSKDTSVVSVYGPFWQTVAGVVARFAGTEARPVHFIVTYKLLGLVSLLLLSMLVWAILGMLNPDEQARGTWLIATNPLCLLELVGSGHNDGLMMVFVLLGLVAQLRGRTIVAIVCFGFAVLTKWIVLVLAPAYLIFVYARRGLHWNVTRDLVLGTILVIVLGAGLYGKNWAGLSTINAVTGNLAATRFNNSLASFSDAVVLWVSRRVDPASALPAPTTSTTTRDLLLQGEARPTNRPPEPPRQLSPTQRPIKWIFSLLFVVWAGALLRGVRGIHTLVETWGWTFIAYLCLASVWFWPWYCVWPLALAALVPRTSLARTAVLFSATAMLITIARTAQPAFGASIEPFVLPTFLPPLAYATRSYVRSRRLQFAHR